MQQQSQLQQENNLMDFKVLSKYDDLFTDVFLDNLFLWFDTIKMNHDHRRPRISNTKILNIIQRNILEKAKPMDAVNELLEMDYFKQYLAIKNQKQIQEFIQHMKRYLYMYMPNAGYEVGDTRRYGGNGRKVEACLVATKDWHVGDEMRLLTGMIACLDPKDDAELKKGNRDFSVMWSTRKNCSCLFLGPARFANHDCDSNCRFISLGQNSITFKVVKEIKFGQEITVYYGKHYFGENNCECQCITCEKQGMGYFATLETKENTPIDNREEDQCGIRRSTRKRKPALHEDYSQTASPPRRSKRASIEPLPLSTRYSIDSSLEELIDQKQTVTVAVAADMELLVDSTSPLPSSMIIKQEELPPIPISPTIERMARLRVMSIGFLCGISDEEEGESQQQSNRRISDCPLLDLLVDAAVMDAEYLKEKKYTVAAATAANKQITVVVNPEIHRDATNRVFLQQQLMHQQQPHIASPLSSPIEGDSSESKADSAVSLSPRLSSLAMMKKEDDDRYWRREMDDGLFISSNNKDEIDEDRALDDFLDDVSDLSSVSSTWTSGDEEEEEEEEEEKHTSITTKKTSKAVTPSSNQELTCIACSRPLKKQDISEQVGADMQITNELATWTWSPSAIFIDWRPKRCPRCERHFTIFKQEWPNRKIKKKKVISKKLKKGGKKSLSSSSSSNSKKSQPSSPFPIHSTTTVETANPSTPIYQMQDDPDDLNYIPPSPLSEVVYDEEDYDTF